MIFLFKNLMESSIKHKDKKKNFKGCEKDLWFYIIWKVAIKYAL